MGFVHFESHWLIFRDIRDLGKRWKCVLCHFKRELTAEHTLLFCHWYLVWCVCCQACSVLPCLVEHPQESMRPLNWEIKVVLTMGKVGSRLCQTISTHKHHILHSAWHVFYQCRDFFCVKQECSVSPFFFLFFFFLVGDGKANCTDNGILCGNCIWFAVCKFGFTDIASLELFHV